MLFIVPTPIGNLKDITLRALEVLKSVDFVLAEDTRHTGKLLETYEISVPQISFHEHTPDEKRYDILVSLQNGKKAALVSDGGMPVISDPGFELIHEAILSGVPVEVLPGANAALTALVASGLAVDAFSFFGFLPPKRTARQKKFTELKDRTETLVFYESPFRIKSFLEDAEKIFGDREVAVARELTKKFEEVLRGTARSILDKKGSADFKGEIVVLISGAGRKKLFEVSGVKS